MLYKAMHLKSVRTVQIAIVACTFPRQWAHGFPTKTSLILPTPPGNSGTTVKEATIQAAVKPEITGASPEPAALAEAVGGSGGAAVAAGGSEASKAVVKPEIRGASPKPAALEEAVGGSSGVAVTAGGAKAVVEPEITGASSRPATHVEAVRSSSGVAGAAVGAEVLPRPGSAAAIGIGDGGENDRPAGWARELGAVRPEGGASLERGPGPTLSLIEIDMPPGADGRDKAASPQLDGVGMVALETKAPEVEQATPRPLGSFIQAYQVQSSLASFGVSDAETTASSANASAPPSPDRKNANDVGAAATLLGAQADAPAAGNASYEESGGEKRDGRRHGAYYSSSAQVTRMEFKQNAGMMTNSTTDAGVVAGIWGQLFSHYGAVMLTVVLFLAALTLGATCLVTGVCVSSLFWRRANSGAVRMYVERLPVSHASDIEELLPARGSYDCAFMKPLSSQQLLRIEAYIQEPPTGSMLKAPLTQKSCVMYTSVVSRRLHDGIHPVPLAFACASTSFCVSLADAPHVRIGLRGKDVSLFDMRNGCYVERRSSSLRIPDAWQDFIAAHRTAPHLTSDLHSSALELRECTLVVGALVTVVGELHRDSDGSLSLRPWPGDTPAMPIAPRERWRTSWEDAIETTETSGDPAGRAHDTDEDSSDSAPEARIEKVLVSDDPLLWRKRFPSLAPTCGGGPCSPGLPFWRRLHAAWTRWSRASTKTPAMEA